MNCQQKELKKIKNVEAEKIKAEQPKHQPNNDNKS
jgi:hypothetical protein